MFQFQGLITELHLSLDIPLDTTKQYSYCQDHIICSHDQFLATTKNMWPVTILIICMVYTSFVFP